MEQPPFFVWQKDLGGRLVSLEEAEGDFSIRIERSFENEEQEALLAIAEAAYPRREGSVVLPDSLPPTSGEEARWWSSEFDGIKIPFAVTKSAIDYYTELIRSFQRGEFDSAAGIVQQSVDFEYVAFIEPAKSALESERDDLGDLFVVRMAIRWSSTCGSRCGLEFSRIRFVVVHKDGRVVELLEDALGNVEIS